MFGKNVSRPTEAITTLTDFPSYPLPLILPSSRRAHLYTLPRHTLRVPPMRAGSLEDFNIHPHTWTTEKGLWFAGYLTGDQDHDGRPHFEGPTLQSSKGFSGIELFALWLATLGTSISYVHLDKEPCSPIVSLLPEVC